MRPLIPKALALGIELVAVGPVSPAILDRLIPGLHQRFDTAVTLGAPIPLDPEWFEATRNQYRAGPILDTLIDHPRSHVRVLGVVEADIFAPKLNFIFGQAIVGGCCALIGLARLRPEFYGQIADPELFERRVLIEAVHEIGHSNGLEHCPDPSCVMSFSRVIRDTDQKGPNFCPLCLAQIR